MSTTPLTSGSDHHITPISVYVKTILALVVLMVATVLIAVNVIVPDITLGSYTIPGVWINNVIALAIATLKAYLVIMFFMGVKYSSSLTKLWVAAGFLTFGLMFFILGDYWTRQYEPAPGWAGYEGSGLKRVADPLSEKLPVETDVNVRPRQ